MVPPYNLPTTNNRNDKRTTDSVMHFCFLVHGYQGLSGDLSYLEAMMKHHVWQEKQKREKLPIETCNKDQDDDFVMIPKDEFVNHQSNATSRSRQDVVVHNCQCNEGKTNDGIIQGGERLIHEIRNVIDSNMNQRQEVISKEVNDKQLCDITISILGNSMGGLYGRYAIAKLIEIYCVEIESTNHNNPEKGISTTRWILDGNYRLSLNTFCTTATPHLGVSKHTWIRIPRIAEVIVALCMGETGNDLFRRNHLLYKMATDATFLDPLASFERRIAYANCYGTDFPVPMETAAFLSKTTSHLNHQICDTCQIQDQSDLVVSTLRTTMRRTKNQTTATATAANDIDDDDQLQQMSLSLDNLGWKKVLVDLRREMIAIEIPRYSWMKWIPLSNGPKRAHEDDFGEDTTAILGSKRSNESIPLLDSKNHKSVGSRSIIHTFANDATLDDDRNRLVLRLPLGHNMIVAFARNKYSAFFYKGGRPLVDVLTKELVKEIFAKDDNKTFLPEG